MKLRLDFGFPFHRKNTQTGKTLALFKVEPKSRARNQTLGYFEYSV